MSKIILPKTTIEEMTEAINKVQLAVWESYSDRWKTAIHKTATYSTISSVFIVAALLGCLFTACARAVFAACAGDIFPAWFFDERITYLMLFLLFGFGILGHIFYKKEEKERHLYQVVISQADNNLKSFPSGYVDTLDVVAILDKDKDTGFKNMPVILKNMQALKGVYHEGAENSYALKFSMDKTFGKICVNHYIDGALHESVALEGLSAQDFNALASQAEAEVIDFSFIDKRYEELGVLAEDIRKGKFL